MGTGKGGYGLPTPPASPAQQHSSIATSSSSHANNNNTNGPTPHHAVLAALASQTLLQKMSSAFWDAFSGSGSSSSSGGLKGIRGAAQTHAWDAEKVRKVLEGKAVLKVVDVDQPAVSSRATAESVSMPSSPTILSNPTGLTTSASVPTSPRVKASIGGADVLEEKMRGLSLGCASVCGITSAAKSVGREKRFF